MPKKVSRSTKRLITTLISSVVLVTLFFILHTVGVHRKAAERAELSRLNNLIVSGVAGLKNKQLDRFFSKHYSPSDKNYTSSLDEFNSHFLFLSNLAAANELSRPISLLIPSYTNHIVFHKVLSSDRAEVLLIPVRVDREWLDLYEGVGGTLKKPGSEAGPWITGIASIRSESGANQAALQASISHEELNKRFREEFAYVFLFGPVFFLFLVLFCALIIYRVYRSDLQFLDEQNLRLQSLALFPELSPNPVWRYTFDGVLEMLNRSAGILIPKGAEKGSLFKHSFPEVEFDTITSANAESKRLDFSKTINNSKYNFSVRTNKKHRIVNIYGFNVTEIEEAKEKLSALNSNLESQVRARMREIEELTHKDHFTGLPNRLMLEKLLKEAELGSYSLAMINLNHFGEFNTVYGDEAGDFVIKEFSSLIKKCTEIEEYGFRIAGDEFAVLTKKINISKRLETLREMVEPGMVYQGIPLPINFSAGISSHRDVNTTKNSSSALVLARRKGEGNTVYFDDELHSYSESAKKNLYWLRELRSALDEDRVIPVFQGIRNNKTALIEKYECLVRLQVANDVNNGNEGNDTLVSPFEFLEVAKRSGLLTQITRRMIEKSFNYFSNSEGTDFSLNLAGTDLEDRELIPFIKQALNKYDIKAERVIFEVLEDVSLESRDFGIETLKKIKEMGCKIAIDDFGAENSNFSRLLKLQIDYLKIDGSFIKNISESKVNKKIVNSICGLAKSMGAKTIAEFVSSEKIQTEIDELGVEYSQGFHFSKPILDPLGIKKPRA